MCLVHSLEWHCIHVDGSGGKEFSDFSFERLDNVRETKQSKERGEKLSRSTLSADEVMRGAENSFYATWGKKTKSFSVPLARCSKDKFSFVVYKFCLPINYIVVASESALVREKNRSSSIENKQADRLSGAWRVSTHPLAVSSMIFGCQLVTDRCTFHRPPKWRWQLMIVKASSLF